MNWKTMSPAMRKIVLPIPILVLALLAAVTIVTLRPQVETQRPEIRPPVVRVQTVELENLRLTVKTQGTVSPRTESQIVPEVSGRVIWVSSSLVSGGFFESGEVLLKLDPRDYQQLVIAVEAQVARAQLRVEQEKAEAALAIEEWKDLGEGEADPLTLREPHLQEARAALAAAEANLGRSRRDLERTQIRAPYASRVRSKSVDVGQFVSPGGPLATIYAIDSVEIRLPLPNNELAYLDLPSVYRGERDSDLGPPITLRADFAGGRYEWQGRIVRTEGEIDPASRMVHAVAEVRDPYGRGDVPDRPPLAVGMYVEAEIEGILAEGVAVLPRAALRNESQVLVVDKENRLRFRDVDVLRETRDDVVLRSGLQDGELVCVSPLAAVTDGMEVRLLKDEEKAP
jgi:RND family efflux transporter MFP subunit